MSSRTIAADHQATADATDALLPLLQAALPTIISCSIVDTIVQANAQGCRVDATHDDHPVYTDNHALFVKRIVASDYVATKKSWNDFRRTLLYGRTEVRFYKEILPLLVKKGFPVNLTPTCHVAESYSLDGLIDETSVAWQTDDKTAMPTLEQTMDKTAFLVLDSMDMNQYYQKSPLSTSEALKCLESVAQLHAAAWEDSELLQNAEQRMARGSYHLSTRNPKEFQDMETSWDKFVSEFREVNPSLFTQPQIQALGRRMKEMASYISEQLTPDPTDPYATLTHGDFKAMNVFLSISDEGGAVMIDFASTGVGNAMSDVAMHVIHAVQPTLTGDEEMELVEGYLEALQQAQKRYNIPGQYPMDVATRHYRLACVDYIRFIMGRFWKSASIESFEAKKDSMNTTLVNRNVEAAMVWIERVSKYLAEFEEEKGREDAS